MVAVLGADRARGVAGSTLDRPDEPIVIQQNLPVSDLTDPLNLGSASGPTAFPLPTRLHGIVPGDLVAFAWNTNTDSWKQIPVQVDEREVMDLNRPYGTGYASCSDPCYSKPGDGAVHPNFVDAGTHVGPDSDPTLDSDDEVALMAADAGGRTTSPEAPFGVDADSAVEVQITDPLDSGEGWIYLFESVAGLDPAAGEDYVDYTFQLENGPYKTGAYNPDLGGSRADTAGRSVRYGPRPETSRVETVNYERGFEDRWVDNELRIKRGGATGVDILDRHDAHFDNLDASCVRTQATYRVGEGAFVINKDGPIRVIRDFIGANSGPHVQRQHVFYGGVEEINTFLRVHPVPGVIDFFDYSEDGIGLEYRTIANPAPLPAATIDNQGNETVIPFIGTSGQDGWESVDGPQGGLVMAQRFITNNPDPSYRGNFRDGAPFEFRTCTGDDKIIGASGPQAQSAIANTDEAQAGLYGGGTFNNLYYQRKIYYTAPGAADGPAIFEGYSNPLQLELATADLDEFVPNEPPSASFDFAPASPVEGETVQFSSTSTDSDGTVDSFEWDLDGDGDFDDATGSTASQSYATPGERQVGLRVTDNDGATDTTVETVTVSERPNEPPTASFDFTPAQPTATQNVDFTSTATDSDGTIASLAWDLDDDGDFDDATGPTASRSFPAAGSYDVSLEVTDDDGATDTVTRTVDVDSLIPPNKPPTASFTSSPANPVVGENVDLESTSTDTDGTIATLEWDLDDDGQFDDATGTTASTSFASAGDHDVSLRATDDDGSSDVQTRAIPVSEVPNRAPQSTFTVTPDFIRVGEQVSFTSTATDSDGTIEALAWDLDGDGEHDDATGATATATYAESSSVDVSLLATDDDGATDIGIRRIDVAAEANRLPKAVIEVSDPTPFVGQKIQFRSRSSDPDGPLAAIAWDLDGDGEFDDSSEKIVDYTYDTAGDVVVGLRVDDPRGGVDVATVVVEVEELLEEVRNCFGQPATIIGTPGRDRGKDKLRGTKGDDVIWAGPGNDQIRGRGGDDLLCGVGGKDQIRGGPGRDKLRGGKDQDRLNGGRGRDKCIGGAGKDREKSC